MPEFSVIQDSTSVISRKALAQPLRVSARAPPLWCCSQLHHAVECCAGGQALSASAIDHVMVFSA